jgi:hypothetical protein
MKLSLVAIPVLLLTICVAPRPAVRAADPEDAEPKPRDLGPPLVENLKELKQFGQYPAWLDPKHKQIVLVGETCKADYPLEFFITSKPRAYESVLVVDSTHRGGGGESLFKSVQMALLLCGAKPGHPAYYKDDKTTLATGDEIVIEVRWKNKEGKIVKNDARNWIRDSKTKKSPEKTWVFAGSRFVVDENGHSHFMADGGDFVCVLNNPMAMLDLPVLSSGAIEERIFEANLEKLPPPGTPVTIVLIPKVKPKPDGEKPKKTTNETNETNGKKFCSCPDYSCYSCNSWFSPRLRNRYASNRVTLSSSRSIAKGLRM